MKKVFFFTIISLILLFGIWQSVLATELLLDYPKISGAKSPSETTDLAEIIKYVYMFALGAAGFAALIAMIVGAFLYVTSAGNASKASDAKDRITSAVLGVIILLASVLILRTINPDLVDIGLKLPEINNTNTETENDWYCYWCRYFGGQSPCSLNSSDKPYCNTFKNMTKTKANQKCYNLTLEGIIGALYKYEVRNTPCPAK